MTSPLEKARKLVALAANNTNPNEARNAALQACKIIAEHKLLDGGGGSTRSPFVDRPFVDRTAPFDWMSVFDVFMRGAVQESTRRTRAARGQKKTRKKQVKEWAVAEATHIGLCSRCGLPYFPGELIAMRRPPDEPSGPPKPIHLPKCLTNTEKEIIKEEMDV